MVTVCLYALVVAAVAIERLVELRLSNRNLKALRARGAVEAGQGHFRVMVILHTVFLVSCVAEVVLLQRPFTPLVSAAALIVASGAMALRYWAVSTLGERWNTRVVVLPSEAPVTGGPYRFIRHPNYVAVVAEILALPLIHGAWLTALVFTVANAALLAVRIRVEEQALGGHWAAAFERKPRFLPEVR